MVLEEHYESQAWFIVSFQSELGLKLLDDSFGMPLVGRALLISWVIHCVYVGQEKSTPAICP